MKLFAIFGLALVSGLASAQMCAVAPTGAYGYDAFAPNTSMTKMQRVGFSSAVSLQTIQFGWGGYTVATSGLEGLYLNPITLKAAVEYPVGKITPLTFHGQQTGTITPGVEDSCDALSLSIPANQTFFIRIYFSNNGQPLNLPERCLACGMAGELSCNNGKDVTYGGTVVSNSATAWAPDWVSGAPVNTLPPSVLVLGDSIGGAQNDNQAGDVENTANVDGWTNRTWGWVGTSPVKYGYTNWSKGGRLLSSLTNTSWCYELDSLPKHYKYTINENGRDDVSANHTAAVIEKNMVSAWNRIAACGSIPVQTTLLPHALSTDGYLTLANQTFQSDHLAIQQINSWLRSNTFGGARATFAATHPNGPKLIILDVDSVVESGAPLKPNSLWNAPGTPLSTGTIGTVVDAYHFTDASADFLTSWVVNGAQIVFTTGKFAGKWTLLRDTLKSGTEAFMTDNMSGLVAGDQYFLLYSYSNDTGGIHPSAYAHRQMSAYVKSIEASLMP